MRVTARTEILALLGDPVSHSLSPSIHNAWLEAAGVDAIYVALRIAQDKAEKAFESLSAYGLKGVNVTIPHKACAAAMADRLDGAAAALGVANVLRWEKDGSVSAFNTDAGGVIAALDDAHAGWRSRTGSALVLGAGGAGRAVAWGLSQAGVKHVLIANRTEKAARELADLVPRAEAFPWQSLEHLFASADLIVNATTLGMNGVTPPDWPVSMAPAHAIVMDAVYAPLETALLRAARARGLVALDGLGMLIHQAALAFEIWFGAKPDIDLGRAAAQAALAEREA
jgi:shikimate dehydrogenase